MSSTLKPSHVASPGCRASPPAAAVIDGPHPDPAGPISNPAGQCPFMQGSMASKQRVPPSAATPAAAAGSAAAPKASADDKAAAPPGRCPFVHAKQPSLGSIAAAAFAGGGLPALRAMVAAADSLPLTPRCIAVVKEGWNKCLAFRDRLFFEALSERWFHLYPPVAAALGSETEDINPFLYAWIDIGVHALMPETEAPHRETYPAAHAAAPQRFGTGERYALHLAVLCCDADAMLALDEAFYFALQTHAPYFEEADAAELEDRRAAPLVRFFRQHALRQFLDCVDLHDASAESLAAVKEEWGEKVAGRELEAGRRFYQILFTENDDLLDYFTDTDIDKLAGHLMGALNLVFSLSTLREWAAAVPFLRSLGDLHKRFMIPSGKYNLVGQALVHLCMEELPEAMKRPAALQAVLGVFDVVASLIAFPHRLVEKMHREAEEFFEQAAGHFNWSQQALLQRKLKALREIYATGTHYLTSEELSFGAQLAWRNSAKCSGRVSWNRLLVRDCRHVEDSDGIFRESMEHQVIATAGTNMESVMTVFRPRRAMERWGVRIWNSQFVRFACWEMADGSFLGDPANKHLTQQILKYFPEWRAPAAKTAFDILPFVIEQPGKPPQLYEIPPEVAALVDISHPESEGVASLGWKWCAVPTITNFNLRLAGLDFVCCPFNGWFLDLEVARNLFDRYDGAEAFLPHFPALQLRRNECDDSWVDSIFVEITRAVYHSFMSSRVTMVNRAAITKQFNIHLAREREAGREVPAQWSWIGGLLGPVYDSWKHECRDFFRFPQYEYQADKFLVAPYHEPCARARDQKMSRSKKLEVDDQISVIQDTEASEWAKIVDERGIPSVTILFGSETGTAESYAKKLAAELKLLSPKVATLNDASTAEGRKLLLANVILVITSTFGCGNPPFNAVKFLNADSHELPNMAQYISGKQIKYAVCAIGSSAYPDFCAFGRNCFFSLRKAGALPLLDIVTADEMSGQFAAVTSWIESVKLLLLPPEFKHALMMLTPVNDRVFIRSRARIEPSTPNRQKEFVPSATGQYQVCSVLRNVELRNKANPNDGSSTHRVELDVSCFGNHPYITGDHCAIIPVRSYQEVVCICNALQVDPSEIIEAMFARAVISEPLVSELSNERNEHVILGGERFKILGPSPSTELCGKTWLEVFSVELETSLMCYFLGPLLAALTKSQHNLPRGNVPDDPVDTVSELRVIASKLNEPSLPKFIPSKAPSKLAGSLNTVLDGVPTQSAEQFIDTYVTLAGLFTAFPGLSARIDLADLLSLLPKLRPRYYSISSSDSLSPTTVALTVGLVVEKTSQGSIRRGVCSNFLCNSPVGSLVLASIRRSSFRLPSDSKTPIICVGPGTGFAPFAGFLDERAFLAHHANDSTAPNIGETLCYSGARLTEDIIYGQEIEKWRTVPGIKLQIALSREGSRQRVQDLLKTDREEIVNLLIEQGAYMYVCGDSRMADDTSSELTDMIAKTKGVSRLIAKDMLTAVRDDGRYQLDVWGLTQFFSKGVQSFSDKKADSARAWLQLVSSKY